MIAYRRRSVAERLERWSTEVDVAQVLGESYSYQVLDVESGAVLAGRSASTPRMGASCMKILTAVNALRTFPADHRFRSEVVLGPGSEVGTASDAVRDEEVMVTLRLRGGGDPTLDPSTMAALARNTVERLGDRRRARIVVDEGLFPTATAAPGWRPEFMPIEVQPVVPLILREYFGFQPGEAVGVAFAAALAARGVDASFVGLRRRPEVAGNEAGKEGLDEGVAEVGPGPRSLGYAESATVAALVTHMLQSSHNPTAEVLHRMVAIDRGHAPTWDGAGSAALGVLDELGLSTAGVVSADGSGLSRDSRVRADLLTEVLALVCERDRHPELATIFPGGGLPLAGVTGSLSAANDWFSSPLTDQVRGRLWAKSGSLSGVAALAGIAMPAPSRHRTFAILVNELEGDFPHLLVRRQLERFATIVLGIGR